MTKDPAKIQARNVRRRPYHRELAATKRREKPGAHAAYMRDWRAANREKVRAYDREYYRLHPRKRLHDQQKQRVKRAALRSEMIAAYGSACACCGEAQYEFLTIEHMNRDGGRHRKQVGGNAGVWLDLKRRGWPKDGYAVMCMNCNWGRRFTGRCPHEDSHVEAIAS